MTQCYKTTTIEKNQITGTCSSSVGGNVKCTCLTSWNPLKLWKKIEGVLMTTSIGWPQLKGKFSDSTLLISLTFFYDIISVLKWLDFARPEGFDIIYLLMTKLQTGRNYLLINRIKSKKNPRQITSNKDINSLVYITSEISNFLFWFQKEIIDIWVIFFFLRKVISKVLTW